MKGFTGPSRSPWQVALHCPSCASHLPPASPVAASPLAQTGNFSLLQVLLLPKPTAHHLCVDVGCACVCVCP